MSIRVFRVIVTFSHQICRLVFYFCAPFLFVTAASSFPASAETSHGLSMHGQPALAADYTHLPYANPNAPKGGRLVYGVYGTYDSLNPFIVKSIRTGARGLRDPVFGNLVFENLMMRSRDEPFTLYGLIAERVEVPDDRSSIEFHLNPKARFSDGEAIKVSDVLFTFNLLKDKGRPPYSSRMKHVEKMEQTGERSVKLWFNDKASRETPLLFGLMPVLAEHTTDVATFGESTLVPPVASGPYTIAEVKPGERIVYKRNPNYWALDEPITKGFYNFDEIRVDYYRSSTAQFEAFKKGLYDISPENSPSKWRTAYDFPAVERGEVTREVFKTRTPSGMLGLVFNTRREKLSNQNVRRALSLVFDFEWANENLFFGAYERTSSYWQNSVLSSFGIAATQAEKDLFGSEIDQIQSDVLDGTYVTPKADGSGRDRKVLRAALTLLKKEGYTLKNRKMIGPGGSPLTFELLIAGASGISGQDIERLALSYKSTLSRLGIEIEVRTVDDSQYQARKGSFEYDMTVVRYSSSLSPGAEQVFRWGSQSRDLEGSFNFAGTANPLLDRLINAMLDARKTEDFYTAVRAFDRALISGHYVVPLYHLGETRLAFWKRLSHPNKTSLYGPQFPTWWSTEAN